MYKEYLQKLENLKGKELKGSKKIELGSIQEIKKQTTEIESVLNHYRGLEAALKKSVSLIASAKKLNEKGYDVSNKSTKIGQEFIANAKKLGIDVTGIKEFREYADKKAELTKTNSEILKLLPR
jgi:hypothetical protein